MDSRHQDDTHQSPWRQDAMHQPSTSHQSASGDPQWIWTPTAAEAFLAPRYNISDDVQENAQWSSSTERIIEPNPSSIWSASPAQQLSSASFGESFDAELQEFAYDHSPHLPFPQDYDDAFASLLNLSNTFDMEMMRIDNVVDHFPSISQSLSLPATSSVSSGGSVFDFNDLSTGAPFCSNATQSSLEAGLASSPNFFQHIHPTLSCATASSHGTRSPDSDQGSSSTSTPPSVSSNSSPSISIPSQISCTFEGCQRTFSQQHEYK